MATLEQLVAAMDPDERADLRECAELAIVVFHLRSPLLPEDAQLAQSARRLLDLLDPEHGRWN